MNIGTWRVSNAQYASEAFSGDGASTYGGRWNSSGVPVIYTSESISLACLEVLVGGISMKLLLSHYVKIPVEFDSSCVKEIDDLPLGWDLYPATEKTKNIGDKWVKDRVSLILKVPSTVINGEFNYIINPSYPDAKDKLKIGKAENIYFDPRLIQLLK